MGITDRQNSMGYLISSWEFFDFSESPGRRYTPGASDKTLSIGWGKTSAFPPKKLIADIQNRRFPNHYS